MESKGKMLDFSLSVLSWLGAGWSVLIPRDWSWWIWSGVNILVYKVYQVFLIQPSSSIFPLANEVCDAGSNTFQNYDFGLINY